MRLVRLLILVLLLVGGLFAIGPGLPLGSKDGVMRSAGLEFPYQANRKLRLTAEGPQLRLNMTTQELLPFLYAEFATTKIHDRVQDQQIENVEFLSDENARIRGTLRVKVNSILAAKFRFSANVRVDHEDRALLLTYLIDVQDFPDALERARTRRVPMDKRLRRDCLKIDEVAFVPNSTHALTVAASCPWGEIF